MKTLITIASIILLSYQVDRLTVPAELNKATSKTTQPDAVSTEFSTSEKNSAKLPDINTPAVDIEPVLVPAVDVEKKTSVTTRSEKYFLRQLPKANTQSSHLHQNAKETGNYMAYASIRFLNNKSDNVSTDDFAAIMSFADLLIFDSTLKVSVAGFTDNIGDEDYNTQLSLLRAVNIQNYLVELGVSEDQIIMSANGSAYPVADNKKAEGREINRRVELLLIK